MRYLNVKRFLGILTLLLVLFGASAIVADAQKRGGRRVVIVNHYPHYGYGYGYGWGGYDPWGFNNRWYDPYYSERVYRNQLEQQVRGNRRELEKHREKYMRDGVLTAKERRELADDEKDYQNSLRRLRDHDGD